MRPKPSGKIERGRIRTGPAGTGKNEPRGAFLVNLDGVPLRIVASDGSDEIPWEHVSVSTPLRCPTWSEMDWVKRQFWRPDEVVVQLHVAEADHINVHPNCLHLWRPTEEEIPCPPKVAV